MKTKINFHLHFLDLPTHESNPEGESNQLDTKLVTDEHEDASLPYEAGEIKRTHGSTTLEIRGSDHTNEDINNLIETNSKQT